MNADVGLTPLRQPPLLISALPPGRAQKRAVLISALLLFGLFLAALPFARLQLPKVDVFIPIMATTMFLADAITATLLFAQFAVVRSRALLVLANGYLFTALIVVSYALTFPGALTPTGLFGAGLQSAGWLFIFWHIGLPTAVIAYTLLNNAPPEMYATRMPFPIALATSVASVIAIVCALTWFVTAHHDVLPILVLNLTDLTGLKSVVLIVLCLSIAAVSLLWVRRRSILDEWLLVVSFAWLLDSVFMVLTESRYSVAWYANRIIGISSASFVLFVLLAESAMLYARLALSLKHLRETQKSLIEAEKLAALGRLVAAIAHEINGPVGMSLTVASTLERRVQLFAAEVERGGLKRSSLKEFLASARDASAQLVSNLSRAAERVESFKQVAVDQSPSDRRSFDVSELVEQVVSHLATDLRERDVALKLRCQPDLLVDSYPGPFGQVLTNLAINSMTHAFPDGRKGSIDIKVSALGNDHVEVLFADNGCGMIPEVKRQAFNPLFTTRRQDGATGLGLHLVHNIVVERLGGRISLESDWNAGTTVKMILPRLAPPPSTRTGA